MCWVCDVPIDYLKPTKPYQEEERVKFDKKGKKSSNKRYNAEMKKN